MKKRILGLLLCLALLVGALPAGVFTLSAAAAETEIVQTGAIHTTADDPWVVTSASEIKIAFNTSEDQSVMYIKLGSDITIDTIPAGTEELRNGFLYTNGGNVVLDLAGYTLSCIDESNFSHRLIYGENGRVTINDSMRTDPSTGSLVVGKIDYKYTVPYKDRNTAVLSGDITVNGGVITNNTSSDAHHSVYADLYYYQGNNLHHTEYGKLIMNGGIFKAKTPVFLGPNTKCVFNGGDLRATGACGVYISHEYGNVYTFTLPTFKKLHISNASSNSQALPIVVAFSSKYANSHTKDEMYSAFDSMLAEGSYPFVDRVKKSELTAGASYGASTIMGPKFNTSYDIAPVTVVDSVNLTVTQGAEGETVQYGAGYESDKGYTVPNYTDGSAWKYGVKWEQMKSSYVDLPCNEANTFQGNTAYRVTVKVAASGVVGYELAAPADMTATINGSAAAVMDNGDGTYDISWNFRVRHALDNFALTILKPAKGESPSYNATIPGTGNHYYVADYTGNILWKNGVSWAKGEVGSADYSAIDPDEGYVFEPGEKYTVTILLTIKRTDAYVFAPVDECSATVNGSAATVYKVPFEDNQYGVYCTFTAPGKKVIDSIEITLPEPTAGDVVPYDAAIPEGAGYYLGNTTHGTMWKNNIAWKIGDKFLNAYEENTFIAGYDYYVWIEVVLTDKEKFMFAEKEALTATINGHEVNPRLSGDDSDRCSFSYTFSVRDVIQIDTIAVTIPEPKADARLAYDSEVPEDAGYYVPEYNSGAYESGVMWEDDYGAYSPQDANFFTADKDYTVRIFVDITNPAQYEFVPGMSMEGYVNGHRADLDRISDTRYRVSYTFTVTDSSGESCTVGDVNSDGKVNNRDAMILDRYIAGWTGYDKQIKNLDAADLNRDLSITNRDAMILDRYIAGWEGYDKYIITVTA